MQSFKDGVEVGNKTVAPMTECFATLPAIDAGVAGEKFTRFLRYPVTTPMSFLCITDPDVKESTVQKTL